MCEKLQAEGCQAKTYKQFFVFGFQPPAAGLHLQGVYPMRVMGVDPGTHRTGFGILESSGRDYKLVICGTIRAAAKDPIARRLLHIFESLQKNIQSYKPDVAALETLFFAKDIQAVERIGEARACAMLAASKAGIGVIEYAPTAVKRSVTGNGRASKEQVQFMVKRLLNLREVPAPDAADALAIAMCHLHVCKWKI